MVLRARFDSNKWNDFRFSEGQLSFLNWSARSLSIYLLVSITAWSLQQFVSLVLLYFFNHKNLLHHWNQKSMVRWVTFSSCSFFSGFPKWRFNSKTLWIRKGRNLSKRNFGREESAPVPTWGQNVGITTRLEDSTTIYNNNNKVQMMHCGWDKSTKLLIWSIHNKQHTPQNFTTTQQRVELFLLD